MLRKGNAVLCRVMSIVLCMILSFGFFTNEVIIASAYATYWHIYYDNNGGDGASIPASGDGTVNNYVQVTTQTPTRSGHTFLGWAESPTATEAKYEAGKVSFIQLTSDLTLYAIWTSKIIYDINGGESTSIPNSNPKGNTIYVSVTSAIPERSGYAFIGWATTPSATEPEYSAREYIALRDDLTLYAIWTEVLSGTCGQNGDNLSWELNMYSGELRIRGTGLMQDYRSSSNTPWKEYITSIFSLVVEDGVTSIGNYAFSHCAKLVSITIPDSVTSIGDYAFLSCASLTSIIIPDGVTSMGTFVFDGCTNLISVTISDNVTSIGKAAFDCCASLTSVTIGNSVTSIDDFAFRNCESLASITILGSMTSIGIEAFFGCGKLTSVTIGNSVTSIGGAAFDRCFALHDVYYAGTQVQWDQISIGLSNGSLTSATIHFNDGDDACGDSVWWSLNEETGVLTITGTGAMYNYTSSSGAPWYDSRTSIQKVVIQKGVTGIGNYAFHDCTKLTAVTIPDSVTEIGYYAFYDCTNLTAVTIPGSVTSIGEGAFLSCESLTAVTIPESVTRIGDSAFGSCTSLAAITVEAQNAFYSSDEYGVLYDKQKMTLIQYPAGNPRTAFTIPNSVTCIGVWAFDGSTSLTAVTIPDSVTSIGKGAFVYCTSLTAVTIPDSVTSIGEGAFVHCESIAAVTIPDSVTRIGSGAFQYCTSIAAVTIPDSVTEIGDDAFCGCTTLATVTIGRGVQTINESAFFGCSALRDVYYTGTQAQWDQISVGSYNDPLTSATIHFNDGNDACGDSVWWSLNEETGELTIFGKGAMKDYSSSDNVPWSSARSNIRTVSIENGVTSIGRYAFAHCTSLESITIPDSVTSIGGYAFESCTSLTAFSVDIQNVHYSSDEYGVLYNKSKSKIIRYPIGNPRVSFTIPDGVTSISNYAFDSCTNLASITIPDSVTSIGDWVFHGCTSLTSVIIGNSVTSISDYAFSGCTSLTSVTIGNSVTSIGDHAFTSCSSLISITIPDSVTSIGDSAFFGCSSLASVTIPDSVLNIGKDAFYWCTSLTSVTIPDSVTSIGYTAFCDCTSLTAFSVDKQNAYYSSDEYGVLYNKSKSELIQYPIGNPRASFTISDSVTNIGDHAFYKCTSLTSITIPDSVTTISTNAFHHCKNLASTTIPNSVTSIGDWVFCGCTSLTSVTIPDSVTSIGNYTFDACASLASVTIPNSVTSIGDWAFYICTSLATVCYDGTQQSDITIGNRNEPLMNAEWFYHKHDEQTSTEVCDASAATCTSEGYSGDVYYSPCGVLKQQGEILPIDPDAHNYNAVVTEPTCTVGGYTTYICSRCENTYTSNATNPLGHSFINYVFDRNATCTVDGTKTALCERCDATDTIADEGSALGHSFANYVSDGNATCTVDGTKTAKCERCDVTDTIADEGSALGHDYDAVVTAPTCTEGGYTTYTCKREGCGDSYTDNAVAALGHSFIDYVFDSNATCAVDGTKTALCERCDATDTIADEGSALGHDYDAVVTAPTCTVGGYTTYTCKREGCSDSYTADEIEALGHDFGEWTVTTPAACTTAGVETRGCSRCNVTETRPVAANGHTYNAVVTYPTCREGGYTTYICSVCGEYYIDDPTDALGHNYTVVNETIDPTCTDGGYTTYKCSRCGTVDPTHKDLTDALEHDYTVVNETIGPTCTEGGYTTYRCSRCDSVDSTHKDITDALGHNYTAVNQTVDPTCAEGGYTTYKCSRCGTVDPTHKDLTDALEHDYTVVNETIAPTCTEGGYTTYKCSRCGDVGPTHKDITDALGHNYTAVNQTVDPTCAEGGYTTYKCSRCGTVDSTHKDITDALGHDFGAWTVTTPATCTDVGVELRTCQRNDCDAFETRDVEALGHDYLETVIDPTCTACGYTLHKCSRCNSEYKDAYVSQVVIRDDSQTGVTVECAVGSFTENVFLEVEQLDSQRLTSIPGFSINEDSHKRPVGAYNIKTMYSDSETHQNQELQPEENTTVTLYIPVSPERDEHGKIKTENYGIIHIYESKYEEFRNLTAQLIGNSYYLVIVISHFSPFIVYEILNPEISVTQNTNRSALPYGEKRILTADIKGLPDGAKIVWTADKDGIVTLKPSEDGLTCEVSANKSGSVTVIAKIVDADGKEIKQDGKAVSAGVTLQTKAGFFHKLFFWIFRIPWPFPRK